MNTTGSAAIEERSVLSFATRTVKGSGRGGGARRGSDRTPARAPEGADAAPPGKGSATIA